MYYGDKRQSKVNLAYALQAEGWKIYGYSPDESDIMTDYYCPASWGGIAEKNGFILVIDKSRPSGEKRESYTYTKNLDYDKIEKLQAMTTQNGCTQDEANSAKELIEKIYAKHEESKVLVQDTTPMWRNGNPDNYNWHIEDANGVIVERGTGAFSFHNMPYHWNYETRSFRGGSYVCGTSYSDAESEEKNETIKKFYNLVDKINKSIENPKFCYIPDVKKGYKTVIKAFEIETPSEIQEGQYFMLKSNFNYGCSKGNVYKIQRVYGDGSVISANRMNRKLEKVLTGNGNSSNNFGTTKERLLNWVEKGSIVFVELRGVQDETSKPVLKKAPYTPVQEEKAEVITITGEVVEAIKTVENKEELNNKKEEISKNSIQFEIVYNEKLNGIELYFEDKPSEEVRSILKQNGFRWFKPKLAWIAKNTQERRDFLKSLQCAEESDNNSNEKTVYEFSNVVDFQEIKQQKETQTSQLEKEDIQKEFIKATENKQSSQEENKEEEIMQESDFNFDNILGKFENIDMTSSGRLSEEDQKEINKYEEIFNQTKEKVLGIIDFFENNKISQINYNENYRTYTETTDKTNYYKLTLIREAQHFIEAICKYFEKKYNINLESVTEKNWINPDKAYFSHHEKDYNKYIEITAEQVIDSIFDTLGGCAFAERQDSEIKQNFAEIFKYSKGIKINKNKISIPSSYLITYCGIFKRYEISYHTDKNFKNFLKAINYFEFGDTDNPKLNSIFYYEKYPNSINRDLGEGVLFQKHEVGNKLTGFKIYKNSKVEIEFNSNELARKFAREYLGVNINVA